MTKQMPEWLSNCSMESLKYHLTAYYENLTPAKEKDKRFDTISQFFDWDVITKDISVVRNIRKKKEQN